MTKWFHTPLFFQGRDGKKLSYSNILRKSCTLLMMMMLFMMTMMMIVMMMSISIAQDLINLNAQYAKICFKRKETNHSNNDRCKTISILYV